MKRIMSVILSLTAIYFSMNAQEVLKLTTKLDKKTYLVGEHIQIGISIINNSATPIWRLGRTDVQVLDQHGKQIEYVGPSGDPFSPIANHLNPNEEDYQVIDIHEYFGKTYHGLLPDYYFKSGNYTVKVIYHPLNLPEESVDKEIQVVDPVGEDSLVYRNYIEIGLSEIFHKRTTDQAAEALRLLHEGHPNSVYTPNILVLLDAMYDITLGEPLKARAARRELVEKFSWSVQGRG
ncbi:MAG TPA: hypothetical protein VK141_03780, partial [Nitrosomonas sp.]|nr:hypothetical protein [Nitrosomonas sp.]